MSTKRIKLSLDEAAVALVQHGGKDDWSTMAAELLGQIISYLDHSSLVATMEVNRNWRSHALYHFWVDPHVMALSTIDDQSVAQALASIIKRLQAGPFRQCDKCQYHEHSVPGIVRLLRRDLPNRDPDQRRKDLSHFYNQGPRRFLALGCAETTSKQWDRAFAVLNSLEMPALQSLRLSHLFPPWSESWNPSIFSPSLKELEICLKQDSIPLLMPCTKLKSLVLTFAFEEYDNSLLVTLSTLLGSFTLLEDFELRFNENGISTSITRIIMLAIMQHPTIQYVRWEGALFDEHVPALLSTPHNGAKFDGMTMECMLLPGAIQLINHLCFAGGLTVDVSDPPGLPPIGAYAALCGALSHHTDLENLNLILAERPNEPVPWLPLSIFRGLAQLRKLKGLRIRARLLDRSWDNLPLVEEVFGTFPDLEVIQVRLSPESCMLPSSVLRVLIENCPRLAVIDVCGCLPLEMITRQPRPLLQVLSVRAIDDSVYGECESTQSIFRAWDEFLANIPTQCYFCILQPDKTSLEWHFNEYRVRHDVGAAFPGAQEGDFWLADYDRNLPRN